MKFFSTLALALVAILASCASDKSLKYGDECSSDYLPILKGKRVALLSNHTGIVGNKIDVELKNGHLLPADSVALAGGRHILDVMLEEGVNVTAIFSPEHGFRGTADAGEHVGNDTDPKTGIPILSLYSPGSYRPSAESMAQFDALVVDIQDVGTRFYTYYITMKRLMEACAAEGKKVVIMDRPNPNGFFVDGPILDMSLKSGVGAIPIPVAHGMTLGELALMMNGEGWLADGLICDLDVIKCRNYTHAMREPLVFAPSPNLKEMAAIYAYPSTCYFEGTIVSLGRGTDKPFLIYGHPDMQDCDFVFTPRSISGAKNPPCLDQECHGVDLTSTDEFTGKVDFSYVIDAYNKLGGREDFFLRNGFFDLLTGDRSIKERIIAGATAEDLAASWKEDVAAFKALRAKYLLYPEN
ncbi:MAG: DUF1343 domain-containing protein [Bacteroidales bacterium]|nr:DUF1343 domain-containing protein [Bacteroidales bacterium]